MSAFNTSRQSVGLSYYIELSDQDKRNLDAAGVEVALVPYQLARDSASTMRYLQDHVDVIIVRMEDDRLISWDKRPQTLDVYRQLKQAYPAIRVAIGPNEPENEFRKSYTSTNWGNVPPPGQPPAQAPVYVHRTRMQNLLRDWTARQQRVDERGHPLPPEFGDMKLFAGGWTTYQIGPTELPWPGTIMWRVICDDPYQGHHVPATDSQPERWLYFAGRCLHIYTHNYRGSTDLERLQTETQTWASLWSPPYIIDELGVREAEGTEEQRVSGYLDYVAWLCSEEQQQPGAVGTMVPYVIPFTANGAPGTPPNEAWPPEYILRDPESYRRIGRFVRGQ